jgi:hypothetical protein
MYKQKLTDVPAHILDAPKSVKTGMKWQSDYNIAAWFRFKQLSHDMIKLHIHWLDDSGEQHVCVDQTTVNSSSLLLSGIARLKVTGPISSVSVVLETTNLSYVVDELFVQPTRTGNETKQA